MTTFSRANPLVISPTGDTRVQGFTKLDEDLTTVYSHLTDVSNQVDDLEDTIEGMTGATQFQVAVGTNEDILVSPFASAQLRGHGECRLVKSGSDLKLERVGLGRMWVDGTMVQVPVAGLTLSTSGLAENTLYYVYLGKEDVDADSDGVVDGYTLSLAATASAPIIDANGVMVSSAEEAYTLVGMARTVAGPAWADGERNRLVLSYFNRRVKGLYYPLEATGTGGITATTYTRVSSDTTMLTFLSWGEDHPSWGANLTANITNGQWGQVAIYVDGAVVDRATCRSWNSAYIESYSIPPQRIPATLGYHYVDLYGKVDAASNSLNILADPPCTLHGEIIG